MYLNLNNPNLENAIIRIIYQLICSYVNITTYNYKIVSKFVELISFKITNQIN